MALMWRRVYERCLKPAVGRSLGQVDIYEVAWSQGSGVRTEDWIETSRQGQVDMFERRKKQDRLNMKSVQRNIKEQSLLVNRMGGHPYKCALGTPYCRAMRWMNISIGFCA